MTVVNVSYAMQNVGILVVKVANTAIMGSVKPVVGPLVGITVVQAQLLTVVKT